MTRWISGIGIALWLMTTAGPIEAITVDDVKGLARAGASDAVIMAKIDEEGTVFRLAAEEIDDLRDSGVSNAVITYMINTGKATSLGDDEALEPGDVDPDVLSQDDEYLEGDVTYDDDDAIDYDDDDYSYGGYDDAYQAYDDDRYYTSFDVTFGYYYPHWPGYWYTWYYDPFWWPSWSYYWAYCSPYPYYYWYNDPWTACNNNYYWYYRDCYVGWDPYPGYSWDGYQRTYKGRNVGNRGPVDTAERILKVPVPGQEVRYDRTDTRIREPRTGVNDRLRSAERDRLRKDLSRPSRGRSPDVGVAPGRSGKKVARPVPDGQTAERPERGRVDKARPGQLRGTDKGRPAERGNQGARKIGQGRRVEPDRGQAVENRGNSRNEEDRGNATIDRQEENRGKPAEPTPNPGNSRKEDENRGFDRNQDQNRGNSRKEEENRGFDRNNDRDRGNSDDKRGGGSQRLERSERSAPPVSRIDRGERVSGGTQVARGQGRSGDRVQRVQQSPRVRRDAAAGGSQRVERSTRARRDGVERNPQMTRGSQRTDRGTRVIRGNSGATVQRGARRAERIERQPPSGQAERREVRSSGGNTSSRGSTRVERSADRSSGRGSSSGDRPSGRGGGRKN